MVVRVAGGQTNVKSVVRFIKRNFPGSVLTEEHNNMVQYQMSSEIKLSYLFQKIQELEKEYNIEGYSVSQTTLDHVGHCNYST